MYGSSLRMETWRQRALRSLPMLAAVMPLPSEEVTPPVTKTYFATGQVLRGFFKCYRKPTRASSRFAPIRFAIQPRSGRDALPAGDVLRPVELSVGTRRRVDREDEGWIPPGAAEDLAAIGRKGRGDRGVDVQEVRPDLAGRGRPVGRHDREPRFGRRRRAARAGLRAPDQQPLAVGREGDRGLPVGRGG